MPFGRAKYLPTTLVCAYIVLWFIVGLFSFPRTDLDIYFWPATKVALQGHPFLVYTVGSASGYVDDNGPIGLIPLVASGFLLQLLHQNSVLLLHAVVNAVGSVFTLLMAREALLAIEKLRSQNLSSKKRLGVYATLCLAPPIWQSIIGYGHIEQPLEIYLVLLSLRFLGSGFLLRASLVFGLAILTRTPAALLAIPIVFYLYPLGVSRLLRFSVATVFTGLLVLLPFYLSNSHSLIHSLFTYRSELAIYQGSIWSVARHTVLSPLGQFGDIVLVALLATSLLLYLSKRPGGFTSMRLYASLVVTWASFILLAKTVWPYYFLELFVFTTIYFLARYRDKESLFWLLGLPSLVVCVLALIAEIGATPYMINVVVNLEGLLMFVLISVFLAMVMRLEGQLDRSPTFLSTGDTKRGG